MTCHIAIGGLSWCAHANPEGVRLIAGNRKINAVCEHEKASEAVAFLHLLQDLLVEDAVIVEGGCPWSPKHPDLKKLLHR